MISHLSLGARNLDRAQAFYDAVLAPLGIVRLWRADTAIGYGLPGGNDKLAIKLRDDGTASLCAGPGFHLAFEAASKAAVDDFHKAAVQAGGHSDGEPGPRTHFGDIYYACFVKDLDGHKLEAVHQ